MERLYTMNFGERIQDLRKKKGYSQGDLAGYLNMSRQAVAKWEQNVCEPNMDCLISMAELFDVDLDFLITGKSKEKRTEDVVHKKETIEIKEKELLLDRKDIILLITLITSIIVFIGLFVYALLNPLYWNQRYSFLWWYIPVYATNDLWWFRLLVIASIIGIVYSIKTFSVKTGKSVKV